MSAINRRKALMGIFGVTTISTVAPAWPDDAAPANGLTELLDATLDRIRSFEHGVYFTSTGARGLFSKRQGARKIEKTVSVRFDPMIPEDDGKRFVYAIDAESVDYGTHISTPGDIDAALSGLAKTYDHRHMHDSADVLNKALIYNVALGGDGTSLCSDKHPYDLGMWSNIVPGNPVLSSESLAAAMDFIKSTFVDDYGMKIYARGKTLVVPRELGDLAMKLACDHPIAVSVVDDLKDQSAWFVTTNIDGLVWSEMHPFSIHAAINQKEGKVLVYGHEARVFSYNDPRAIVGSFPS